jgi:ketosteroid isomerase-like protein
MSEELVVRFFVRDGHITRIEEYLDSGKRATIKAAREAAVG